ncbi:putative polyketide synthase [Xylaria telfairii]|nr:putative polyketide synthase [Xylaria telfairii]
MTRTQFRQEPVAIVGFACRLPGGNHSPQKLWDFLERGDVASNQVPATRFNLNGHYDASHKPGTMRPPGGMFIGDVDLADFDAAFFEIGGTEAIAMDPNQRQMLEVAVEALENAGIPVNKLDGAPVACYVGSYASDYGDMQNRDAEDRPANCAIGVGRAIMANRLSYFFNIKGPSVTIDTACSGSLVGLDLACRSIQSGEVDAAIVATSNLYLNPDHVMDAGNVGQAHSPSGYCHTFDIDADGYVKAEAVSCVIIKRLSDAIRDHDPIRAIVRGTASNSNGRTGGIASPNSEAQAAAIRTAYANAGIVDLNETAYLECHGTGTQAGDPIEIMGLGSVFSSTRRVEKPLLIGSIKSNIGHSEPAAGNSGLIKVIMAMEKGIIPGTPLFIKPNPKIDFAGFKVKASRTAVAWPDEGFSVRRASINSFGYGGSNAHAVLERPAEETRGFYVSSYKRAHEEKMFDDDEIAARPYTLVVSANDALSLKSSVQALCTHLANPRVKVNLEDLAYTLSERRAHHWHRAYLTTHTSEINEEDFTIGKNSGQSPKIALVFTGQGAQWPQMGKQLLEFFPSARSILEELDAVLQAQANPPKWSLITELTESRSPDHLRQPEFSQPLVTALQICILAVLGSWGIKPSSVVGHSSGEIAAAYAAGLLSKASAIKTAFYRGRAAINRQHEAGVGMLAVGVDSSTLAPFIESKQGSVWVACFNSYNSLTLSGRIPVLETIKKELTAAGHFARLLQVDLAYHSPLMAEIGEEYESLLNSDSHFMPSSYDDTSDVTMFSSVTGSKESVADALYWKTNMVSPVRFAEAFADLVTKDAPNFIIEVGPSGALAGPVSQMLKSLPGSVDIPYCSAWARGAEAGKSLFDTAGRLFIAGIPIQMRLVNEYNDKVRTIIDLPNYSWNHTIKYWHENAASRDWRHKRFITHDLLGSKIPGTSWQAPTWRKHLNLQDVPWLRDHKMGPDVLVPGAGLATLALESMYQKFCALNPNIAVTSPNELAYHFRNVKFTRAIVVEEGKPTTIMLTLSAIPGDKHWHEFRIQTTAVGRVAYDHCSGLIRVQDPIGEDEALRGDDLAPLRYPQSAKLWYKAQQEVGMGFGSTFQKIEHIESVSGSRTCRATVSMLPPSSKWDPQSYYPVHPAVLDACLQTATSANAAGERSLIKDTMIPALVDDMVINKMPRDVAKGLSVAESIYTGRGRKDVAKSWTANIAIHNPDSGELLIRVRGLNYIRLDVDKKPDPHVFQMASWHPDVSFLDAEKMSAVHAVTATEGLPSIHTAIDLIALKTPALTILEISLGGDTNHSVLWFDGNTNSIRAAYTQYTFTSTDAKALVTVQSKTGSNRNTSFHLMNLTVSSLGLPDTRPRYDLVILKAENAKSSLVKDVIGHLKPLLSDHAYTLLWTNDGNVTRNSMSSSHDGTYSPRSVETLSNSESGSGSRSPQSIADTPATAVTPDVTGIKYATPFIWETKKDGNLSSILDITEPGDNGVTYFCHDSVIDEVDKRHHQIVVVRFSEEQHPAIADAHDKLNSFGWKIAMCAVGDAASSVDSTTDSTVILVLDELSRPVLANITERQWNELKTLISTGLPLLWVTHGGQTGEVTEPDNAMVHGLFRVIRREESQANLTTLDVNSPSDPSTAWAIDQVMQKICASTSLETEYAERQGIMYLQRLRPDRGVNYFKAAESGKGLEPIVGGLHANKAQVRIQAEKVGTLQSLTWCETAVDEVPIEPGMVEIEVMAVGVNFKDVATTMGIVPENEYMIGCECTGYVKRIAPGLKTSLNVGDRVAAMRSGTYVNRVQCHHERVHRIPNSMSFEDAATIPLVYLTAIYSLYHLGNLKEGQTVLIHSAAGGVGIAAIQLAQYKKCDVFVTVGTDDKREFLSKNFGIPVNRMFSSRSTRFAEEIRRETGGRGIDVILNSLIGELLDESWRLTADGGIFVEIGKRDIIDRNTLAMEPFDRNCSFRAVDLSYVKEISNELIGRLMSEIFDLVEGGHIGPIHPISVYGFDRVVDALSYIRRGQHVGKIVVSSGVKEDVQLPIRPAMRRLQLDPNASYVIIGGLRGLCGSVAVHLATHGARQITVVSRSGNKDDASARITMNCAAYGCSIINAKGDVGDMQFVRSIFRNAQPRRVAGLILGAMVLRDKPYETMSHGDYQVAIHAKVKGTWNLHQAALEVQKEPLDFFTMLSSISSIVGNKGQANYAAANAFLDAFASFRLRQGLNANSVNLGVIEDVGYVAEQGSRLEARFDKRQWTPINEGMLRRIMNYSIFQQSKKPLNPVSTSQLVTGLAFPLVPDDSGLANERRFGYLFGGHGAKASTDDADADDANDQTAQAIKAFGVIHTSGADLAALVQAAVGLLAGQITKILRLETEMEPGKPLMAYGLDSLSAVELRGWVRQKLGAELSTLDITNASSLIALGEKLVSKLPVVKTKSCSRNSDRF